MNNFENLFQYSKEELIELIEIYSKNWLALDGVWFQSLERKLGMNEAMYHDAEAWERFTAVEAGRNINDDEIAINGNTLTYSAVNCRVQTARKRKGMPFHPCKSVGLTEYSGFASVIDDRFVCECISCYPDITDDTCCCKWKFTLKEYNFYGWENALAEPVTNAFPNIKNPRDLYDILSEIWSADTCAPRMRDGWSPENKTLGQCSITAFLVQDIFGGEVYGILREGGNYHCYNVIDGCVFDLTSEQFGEDAKKLIYENNPQQFREVHFEKEEKRLRYEHLKSALIEKIN